MIAYNLLKPTPHYRRDVFDKGLAAAGFKVRHIVSSLPNPEDILVIWNRYGMYETIAQGFERVGAKVFVIENGYYQKTDNKFFAISYNQHHHGMNRPGFERPSFPYAKGNHILICAQRGIGSKLMRSPHGWAQQMRDRLQTNRMIVLRPHPGKNRPARSVADDLSNCHVCIIWSSACGIEALANNIPVIYCAPRWIGEESAIKWHDDIDLENLPYKPQQPGFTNALTNQWGIDEIEKGCPFI